MTTPQLTEVQEAALERFARENGRRWKAELNYIWMTGRYQDNPDACYLQQVRNQFGPGWLVKYRLPEANRTAEVMRDNPPPVPSLAEQESEHKRLEEERHSRTVFLPDGYNGELIECEAEPLKYDGNLVQLRVAGSSHLTRWARQQDLCNAQDNQHLHQEPEQGMEL